MVSDSVIRKELLDFLDLAAKLGIGPQALLKGPYSVMIKGAPSKREESKMTKRRSWKVKLILGTLPQFGPIKNLPKV
jgi:hypothetical protein